MQRSSPTNHAVAGAGSGKSSGSLGVLDSGGPSPGPAARLKLSGVQLDHLNYTDVLGRIDRCLRVDDLPLALVSINLDHFTYFASRGLHWGALDGGKGGMQWLFLADGWPISYWAARLTGTYWPLVPGSDLLPLVLELMDVRNLRL